MTAQVFMRELNTCKWQIDNKTLNPWDSFEQVKYYVLEFFGKNSDVDYQLKEFQANYKMDYPYQENTVKTDEAIRQKMNALIEDIIQLAKKYATGRYFDENDVLKPVKNALDLSTSNTQEFARMQRLGVNTAKLSQPQKGIKKLLKHPWISQIITGLITTIIWALAVTIYNNTPLWKNVCSLFTKDFKVQTWALILMIAIASIITYLFTRNRNRIKKTI